MVQDRHVTGPPRDHVCWYGELHSFVLLSFSLSPSLPPSLPLSLSLSEYQSCYENDYLAAKSLPVASFQPVEKHQQYYSHHQDVFTYETPVMESVKCNRHKDQLVVHRPRPHCYSWELWAYSSQQSRRNECCVIAVFGRRNSYDPRPNRTRELHHYTAYWADRWGAGWCDGVLRGWGFWGWEGEIDCKRKSAQPWFQKLHCTACKTLLSVQVSWLYQWPSVGQLDTA